MYRSGNLISCSSEFLLAKEAAAVYYFGPIGVTIACNVCFFMSTAMTMIRNKLRSKRDLNGGDNKRHGPSTQSWYAKFGLEPFYLIMIVYLFAAGSVYTRSYSFWWASAGRRKQCLGYGRDLRIFGIIRTRWMRSMVSWSSLFSSVKEISGYHSRSDAENRTAQYRSMM